MLDLAVRPVLILGFAWLLARCLSRATPATRHLVWHSAVIAALATPILIPLAPKFEIGSLPPSATITRELGTWLANPWDALSAKPGASHPITPGTSITPSTARNI